nr:uncharacterized protein LOC115120710 [Oncorhynchus nerka]
MDVLINWLRSVLLCWTYLVVFLTRATSMIPNQEQVRSETPMGQKDTDFDDVSFLRTKSSSFVSSSQPIRPYSLSVNEGDYHYAPKPKHLRHNWLLRILGSSFDPFWMSIERPAEARVDTDESGGQTASRGDPPAYPALTNYTTKEGFNFGASPELTEGAARYQRKLQNDAEDLNLSELPADVARTLRDWLVRSATCGMRYQWVKLAPVFWPRWLRHTDCEKSVGSRSCSFPSGMAGPNHTDKDTGLALLEQRRERRGWVKRDGRDRQGDCGGGDRCCRQKVFVEAGALSCGYSV